MKDIKITNTGELEIVGHDLVLISGEEALLQRIKRKLLFLLRDWYIDASKGLDYTNIVLVKNPNLNYIDNMVIMTITDDSEIIKMVSYKSELNNVSNSRKLKISFSALSVYGIISFSGAI